MSYSLPARRRPFARLVGVTAVTLVLALIGAGVADAAPGSGNAPDGGLISHPVGSDSAAGPVPGATGGPKSGAVERLGSRTVGQSAPSKDLAGLERAVAAQGATTVLIAHTDSATDVPTVAVAATVAEMTVRNRMPKLNAVSVSVPSSQVKAAIGTLRAQAGVTSVTIASTYQTFDTPNDPQYPSKQAPYLGAVNAPEAWDVQRGSADIRIAVIDTGVDVTHPDLAGKVVGTYNAVDGSTDVTDDIGHGTFVAGVAAAATNNAVGVAGAGRDSSLLAVKVADPDGVMVVDDIAVGITWAADHGARIINISLGGADDSYVVDAAIDYALSKGALVVAAAGNDSSSAPMYPAAYSKVIAVGATNGNARASFSQYGSWVDVAAPGVQIYSTTPVSGSEIFPAVSYASGDGTSYSSPLVAGEAALIAAQKPGISVADLRTAITASAHGFAGLGLGTGRVDFRAAFDHIRPAGTPTITAPTSSVSGSVRITAASTAPKVRFQVDGSWLGAPVSVVGGAAAATWSSWGARNGSHTVTAVSCSASGAECGSAAAARTFSLANKAPAVRTPAAGTVVGGTFTITATAPGGGVAFYIDGVKRGFDGSPPFSLTYSASALRDGTHRVKVISCSATGAQCSGPASTEIRFTAKSLHPTIGSLSPSPMSPNKDGRRDTTTVGYRLPESQVVAVHITDSHGRTVRSARLGTQKAGTHTWTWTGTNNSKHLVPDGRYSVTINTSKRVGAQLLVGSVSRSVTVDTMAPMMTSIAGLGATFYPARDGFKDSFAPTVKVSERSTLTLTVRNAKGAVVRTVAATRNAGRQSLSWNGADSHGKLVPAGAYTFTFGTKDAAGNVRTSGRYRVTASSKKLVAKTATVTRNGSQFTQAGATNGYCSVASTSSSDFFPDGLWLYNECDSSDIAAGFYTFTVPAAARYRTLRLDVYGFSVYGPAQIRGDVRNATNGEFVIIPGYRATTMDMAWRNLGTVNAAGRVSAGHSVTGGVFVTTETGYASDIDVRQIKLTVAYDVLQ